MELLRKLKLWQNSTTGCVFLQTAWNKCKKTELHVKQWNPSYGPENPMISVFITQLLLIITIAPIWCIYTYIMIFTLLNYFYLILLLLCLLWWLIIVNLIFKCVFYCLPIILFICTLFVLLLVYSICTIYSLCYFTLYCLFCKHLNYIHFFYLHFKKCICLSTWTEINKQRLFTQQVGP